MRSKEEVIQVQEALEEPAYVRMAQHTQGSVVMVN